MKQDEFKDIEEIELGKVPETAGQPSQVKGFQRKQSSAASMMKQKDLDELMVILEKESERMKFTDMYVDKPCLPCCVCYFILIVLMVIAFGAKLLEPTLGGDKGRDYGVMSSIEQQSWDKIILGNEYMTNTTEAKYPQQTLVAGAILFLYKAREGKDLLTVDAMKDMREVEKTIMTDEDYKKFCFRYGTDQCQGVETIAGNIGYSGLYTWLVGDTPIEDITDDILKQNLLYIMENDPSWPAKKQQLDKNLSKDNLQIKHAQTAILIGGPQEGYDSLTAGCDGPVNCEQTTKLKEWLKPVKDKFTEDNKCENQFKQENCGSYSTLEPNMFADVLLMDEILLYFGMSALLLVLAFFFVFAFFWYQLESALLAGAGISIILLSFPATSIITGGILQISYFGFLHIIGIFLVIGIAADDIFVFMDAWKQSEHVGPEAMQKENDSGIPKAELKRRMAYSFRRSARAMSITSSTTAAAFFANLFSPIMPIQSFGVFSGFLIPMNFLLVVIVMPCTVIWWEENIKGQLKYCCISRTKEEIEAAKAVEREISKSELFFDGTWNKCIMKMKWIIIFLSLCWAGVTFYFASTFEPPSEPENFLVKSNPVQIVLDSITNNFPQGANNYMNVIFSWGIKGVDDEGTTKWDADRFGTIVWDESFDPFSYESLNFLNDMCSALDSPRPDYVPEGERKSVMSCWVMDFIPYLQSGFKEPLLNSGETKTATTLQDVTTPQATKDEFITHLEAFMETWTGQQYKEMVALRTEDGQKVLKFFKVTVKAKVAPWGPAKQKEPYLEKFNAFQEEWNNKAPAGMKDFTHASLMWQGMPTEKAFFDSAIQGIGIALGFATIVLLIVTRNLIVTITSIFNVAVIITSMATFMVWNGQKMGVNQSLALVMLVGFSVDYVLHLGTDYMHSPGEKRDDKMRQSYREMGVSILSGSITTIGCGFWLLFAQVIMFQVFGFVIVLTIIMAFLLSMGTFGAMMHALGPEKDFCTIMPSKKH